ncbi:MAG: hypothetical protein A3F41_05085 [Coxiella sp. RIFCSPHIGHO2_12_FULL_44_14]|nr:MAG: hypothetical protein A3F41_05085 [Coxiella sp. RIFCSPHIGHO2_12_FULL_44_14]
MIRYIRMIGWVCCVGILLSCSPIKTEPVNTYTLGHWKNVSLPLRGKTESTLLVTMPIAASGYQSAAMIYLLTPYELKSYVNNRWVASPAQMLLPLLVDALSRTGYFYAVASAPFSGMTQFRLDTQLLTLQQEFLLPTSRVRLVIQAFLIRNRDNRIVASQRFSINLPAVGNTPYSGVLAANKAVFLITQQIAAFCINHAKVADAK